MTATIHHIAASSQAAPAGAGSLPPALPVPATIPSPERKSLTASRAICGRPLSSGDERRAAGEALPLEKDKREQVGAPTHSWTPFAARHAEPWRAV